MHLRLDLSVVLIFVSVLNRIPKTIALREVSKLVRFASERVLLGPFPEGMLILTQFSHILFSQIV